MKYDFLGFFMTLTLQFDLDYGQNSTKWMHILIILAHTVILSYRWAKSVNIDLQLISEHKGPPCYFFTRWQKNGWKMRLFKKIGHTVNYTSCQGASCGWPDFCEFDLFRGQNRVSKSKKGLKSAIFTFFICRFDREETYYVSEVFHN